MNSHEDPSILIRIFEGEDQDLDFFKDSFNYQVIFFNSLKVPIQGLKYEYHFQKWFYKLII
jgi:hypothetical protein